jgi:YD repeat-containing protein
LFAGSYVLTRNTDIINNDWGSLPGGMDPIPTESNLYVDLTYYEQSVSTVELVGPGVRIKKIISSDNVTGKKVTKTFEYTNGDILTAPKFYQRDDYFYDPSNGCFPLVVGSNVLNHLATSSGSYVGYGQVTEYQEENAATAVSKTVFTYHNNPSYGCPFVNSCGIPSVDDPLNGCLLNQRIFTKVNGNWKILKEVNNVYTAENELITPMFSYKVFPRPYPWMNLTRLIAYGIHSNFIKLASSTVKTFSSNTKDSVSVTTENQYNNAINYYGLSESKTIASDGKEIKKRTLYPYNYNTGDITSALKSAYMIDLPVETYTISGADKVISSSLIKYKTGTALGLLDEAFEMKSTSAGLKLGVDFYPSNNGGTFNINSYYTRRMKYDNYDTLGNILQLHKENDMNVSYIWGYNQRYPVIKAENLTIDELKTAVGLATGNLESLLGSLGDMTSTAQKSQWKSFNTTLRNGISKTSLITTYTYKPLVGITSSTDPNGIITYYVYDAFGRLKLVKDKDGKILKTYQYNYQTR